MKRFPVLLLPLAGALFAPACTSPLVVDESGWPVGLHPPGASNPHAPARRTGDGGAGEAAASSAPGAAADATAAGPQEETPLYGWSGERVGDATPTQSAPSHGLEPADGGRMRIIELYQAALDERDALRDELDAVNASLEGAHQKIVELETQTDTLRRRVGELEAEKQSMQAENLDLAARLTTAQIRRLEAEKLLLENRVARLREEQARAGGSRPTPRGDS